jgi:ribosomal protein S18 acetylase RimI-like enzyme
MQQHPGNKVWLHFCCVDLGSFQGDSTSTESRSTEPAEEYIVGFSSLGTTTWKVPPPDGDRRTLGYIPMLALASGFQGKQCSSGRRYSDLIMEHLLTASQQQGFREVGLLVDPDNQKALCLYRRFGFTDAGRYKRNICMIKSLDG